MLVGLVLRLISRYERGRAADVLLGIGMIFFGMEAMRLGVGAAGAGTASRILSKVSAVPILSLLVAAAVTAVIQSSAATIVVAQRFAIAGLITFPQTLPIVLGANIGTCATALLGSLGANREGRKVAIVHLFYKVAAVVVVFILLEPFAGVVERFSAALTDRTVIDPTAGRIANAHMLFNLFMAVGFLPFTGMIARTMDRIIPSAARRPVWERRPSLKAVTDDPDEGLQYIRRQAVAMALGARDMLSAAAGIFEVSSTRPIEDLEHADQNIDLMEEILSSLLAKIPPGGLDDAAEEVRRKLFYTIENIERIGDVVVTDLARLARKTLDTDTSFSIEGHKQLVGFHDLCLRSMDGLIEFLKNPEKADPHDVLAAERVATDYERRLQNRHLERLTKGVIVETEAFVIYSDIVVAMRYVHYLIADTVRALMWRAASTRGVAADAAGE